MYPRADFRTAGEKMTSGDKGVSPCGMGGKVSCFEGVVLIWIKFIYDLENLIKIATLPNSEIKMPNSVNQFYLLRGKPFF